MIMHATGLVQSRRMLCGSDFTAESDAGWKRLLFKYIPEDHLIAEFALEALCKSEGAHIESIRLTLLRNLFGASIKDELPEEVEVSVHTPPARSDATLRRTQRSEPPPGARSGPRHCIRGSAC